MGRRVLAVVLASALLVAGCSSSDHPTAGKVLKHRTATSDTTTVRSGAGPVKVGPVFLDRPAGLTDLQVTAKPRERPGFVPDGLAAAGSPVEITPSGTDPTGPVRVGFPVPKGVDPATVFVATLVDGAWVPQPAQYDITRNAVFAPSDHLSSWTALTGDVGRTVGELAQAVKDQASQADVGAPPDCGPAPLPPSVATVVLTDVDGAPSGPTARVDSCALVDQGQLKVRLANRRSTSIAVDLPSGVARTGGDLPAAGASSTDILHGVDTRFGSPATALLPGGGTLELSVPEGTTTLVGNVSIPAILWSLLFSAANRVPGGWGALAQVAADPAELPAGAGLDKLPLLQDGLTRLVSALAPDGKEVSDTVAAAIVGSVVLATGDQLKALQPGSGLTATITAPATAPPAAPGTVCGTITPPTGRPVQVTVAQGQVSCPAALGIIDTYLNHPPAAPTGNGYVQVGDWACVAASTSETARTGAAGSCSGPGDGIISLTIPRVAVDPSTWLITADGVGPLRIGMTPADVLGLGLATSAPLSACNRADPDTTVDGTSTVGWETSSQPIKALFVRDPRVATANGIRVGSTIDAVRAAYPGIPNAPDTGGQNPGYLVDGVAGTGNEVYFHIDATTQDVDEIAVAAPTPDRKPLVKLHACG